MIGFLSALFLGKDVVKESCTKAGNELDYQYNRYNIPRQRAIMNGDNKEMLKELQMLYKDMQLAIMWNFPYIKGAYEVNKAVDATLAFMQLKKEGYNFCGDTIGLHRSFRFLDKEKLQCSAKAVKRLMNFANPDAPIGENRHKLEYLALGGHSDEINKLRIDFHNGRMSITNEREFQELKKIRELQRETPAGDVMRLLINRVKQMRTMASPQVREQYADHVVLSKIQGKKPMTFGQYISVRRLSRYVDDDPDFASKLDIDNYKKFDSQIDLLTREYTRGGGFIITLGAVKAEAAFEEWRPGTGYPPQPAAHYPWILEDFTNRI